jgi:membrane protein
MTDPRTGSTSAYERRFERDGDEPSTNSGQADERRAPDDPTDLRKQSYVTVLKRTLRQFSADKLNHWAAALTYYGVLSLFPAVVALVSLLGVLGEGTTQPLIDNVTEAAPSAARDVVTGALEGIQNSQGASGFAFVAGIAGAIWAASGYIGAFMDASNSVWDVPEGRPMWKKLPLRIAITVMMLVLATALSLAIIVSGPIAQQVGNLIGAGDTAVQIWDIAKWPVMVLVVGFMLAVLYWAAPNVKQPKFAWVSPGGLLAVLIWIAASALFALYVANFSSYNETYGSLGGVIAFLVWLWITNIAILLGAEFNAELERGRAVQAGHDPHREPYVPLDDDRQAVKNEQKERESLEELRRKTQGDDR